jgi:hypothetical protein
VLVKASDAQGPVLVRRRFDENDLSPSARDLARVRSWKDSMPVEALLEERGGPFLGTYVEIDRPVRDGRRFIRFTEPVFEYCLDVEVLPDGKMGEVIAVPAEEAWRIAHERDRTRKNRVVAEEDFAGALPGPRPYAPRPKPPG